MIKTLLVDTNRASIPIYKELIKEGHEVTVIGKNKREPLAQACNNYHCIDYADINQLKEFIQKNDFDHFVPGCTDVSYKVLSEIIGSNSNNIDDIQKFKTIFEKDKFKELSNELKLSVARTLSIENLDSAKEIIIKPNDSYSGIGIERVLNPTIEKVKNAINNAKNKSKSENIILEEYIDGQLYSHSAIIKDKSIVKDFFIKEDNSKGYFHVDTSCVEHNIKSSICNGVRKEINKIISKLSLESGIIHTQFISKGSNYYLLECTRRCPGDLYSLLVQFSTGYNYAKNYIAPFINQKPEENMDIYNQKKYIIRHTVSSCANSFFSLNFNISVKLKSFYPLITTGQLGISESQRVAICFFESKTLEEHKNLYTTIMEGNLYSFD